MLFILMGQSCTGKSTAAETIKEITPIEIYTGKDYTRLAKNEKEAWIKFMVLLSDAASQPLDDSIAYLITDVDAYHKVKDIPKAIKIKFTADLSDIKSRFSNRLNKELPLPIEKMLEKQYQDWLNVPSDYTINTSHDEEEMIKKIIRTYS